MAAKTPSALVLVFDGVEEIEALTPVDILRRAGVKVTIASVSDSLTVVGRNNIQITAESNLDQTDHSAFDLFLLPGGPGVLELIGNQAILDILKSRAQNEQRTAAICAAPKVLATAGILDSIPATGHSSVRSDLPNPSDERVVSSGSITSSQGVGTAIEFSLALVKQLVDKQTANEIAASIHF
ncbi:DJ-1/PfpI family protein [Puniceicoccaceae bacterium K14]|nr:DJ-1/PfpI family protein [Puniceicoccaceae bacterium K14]